jgi:hypothetical protein
MAALLALGPLGAPAVAAADSADSAGTAAQPADRAQNLRLDVDAMTPRVVTSAAKELTVTGRITNVGDRRVDEVQVRLQRGEPVRSDAQMRGLGAAKTDSASSPFVSVAESLDRGDTVSFKVTAALRGADQSLALAETGVYPVLVNVNGQPEYGGQERLAEATLPLPVLSLAGGPAVRRKPSPPAVTFIWPVLDTQPRRLSTTDGQVVLTDDDLAASLSVGGRLFGLVNSVTTAAAANSTLLRSMCFALDPDLLQTVDAMAKSGYLVRTAGGQLVAGKGTAAAKDWLSRLGELVRGQCVISVPFSDADLVALSRSGAFDLSPLSLGSSSVVSQLLGVQPAKDLYWPSGGTFDQRTLVDLASLGPATVLADPGHLRDRRGKAPYQVSRLQAPHPVRALPLDPLLSRSLTPSRSGGALQVGMASLAFRTLFDPRTSEQVIVAPPRRWTASESELGTFLGLARDLFAGGYATPQSLMQVTSGANRGTTVGLSYTPQDSAHEVPRTVTTSVYRINHTKRDLLEAMDDDNASDVDPTQLLAPMQYGLLRGVSTAWRGHPDRATAWVEYVDQQVAALCSKVVVRNPNRPLALASGDSPIPVNVYNGLPVAIVVRIELTASAGLRPVRFTDIRIPAQSSRGAPITAEVIRAGRFTVDASLTTRGGTKLGSTARLELTSTSYGVITVAITGVAGGVLILLVVIRLFRRVRAARAGTKDEVLVDA